MTSFIKHVFGSSVYKRVAQSGWCACGHQNQDAASCVDTPFFYPHAEKGRSTLDQLSGGARAAVEAKIRELYTEDVTFYEWNRRLRNRDGSAPDGVGCT